MCILSFLAFNVVVSLVNVCFNTLLGITVRKINHENTRIANQGAGFSCGMSLEVVGGHQSLA